MKEQGRFGGRTMGWLFTIGFMIAGCVSGNTDAFICAGLFAIAGAIAFNCNSGSK